MKKTLLLTIALGAMTTNITWAASYEWTSAWAMGVSEHLVDDGNGNELNISCPDDEDRYVSGYATIGGKQYSSGENGGFDVVVDGVRYSDPLYTGCHVCGANFPSFWKALRNANNLQISAEGKTVNLPTKNIKKILLPLDHKENSCRSEW